MFVATWFPALWFVVDLLSTTCALNGLYYFDRVREDFSLEIQRGVHKNRGGRVERFVKELQLASLFSRSGNLGPDWGEASPPPVSRQDVPTTLGAPVPPRNDCTWLQLFQAHFSAAFFFLTYSLYIPLTAGLLVTLKQDIPSVHPFPPATRVPSSSF